MRWTSRRQNFSIFPGILSVGKADFHCRLINLSNLEFTLLNKADTEL